MNLPSNNKKRIIYITSFIRSGSTLLSRMIAESENTFFVGESISFWQEGVLNNELCGCGSTVRECDFWKRILEDAGERWNKETVERLASISRKMQSFRKMLFISKEEISLLSENVGLLFELIFSHSNASVIIDSSKIPWFVHLLYRLKNFDVTVVHLIRDSRAVAYSLMRTKLKYEIDQKTLYMLKAPPWKTSIGWMLYLVSTYFLGLKNSLSYSSIRYEDLVSSPEEIMAGLCTYVDLASNLIIEDRNIFLSRNHSLAGNPLKSDSGWIKLALDEEWETSMREGDRLITTLLTLPFLVKFHYFQEKE